MKPTQMVNEFIFSIKQNKLKSFVYFILRLAVVMVGIRQLFLGNYNSVFMCVLTLVLFLVPVYVNKYFNIELPNTLEIIIILFIFSAEILGEVNEYYLTVPHWDTVLHTINGFIMGGIGFALIDILNRSEKVSMKLSPFFVALTAFCFSMTTGIIWEFFEFGMDMFFKTDMQKDTVVTMISSVMFNPEGANVAVKVPIQEVIVNGEVWNYGGYIDIGLIDTMKDLIVNFVGAVVFSVVGLLYTSGRSKFAEQFIPKHVEPEVE
ncbi:MAG TPA: hypothetical protein DCY20_05860 [Firmicutes bacterium]|nr:hypothetical protein [Bacillota bacterium]